MPDQSQAPYLDALVAHVKRGTGRLHIPGHKGYGVDPELKAAIGEAAILHDLPAGLEWIDIGEEPTPDAEPETVPLTIPIAYAGT